MATTLGAAFIDGDVVTLSATPGEMTLITVPPGPQKVTVNPQGGIAKIVKSGVDAAVVDDDDVIAEVADLGSYVFVAGPKNRSGNATFLLASTTASLKVRLQTEYPEA